MPQSYSGWKMAGMFDRRRFINIKARKADDDRDLGEVTGIPALQRCGVVPVNVDVG